MVGEVASVFTGKSTGKKTPGGAGTHTGNCTGTDKAPPGVLPVVGIVPISAGARRNAREVTLLLLRN